MNNKFYRKIQTTVLSIILTFSGFLTLSPVKTNALESPLESTPNTTSSQTIARSSSEPLKEFSTTRIYQHLFKNQNAATLYVHQLPLLTFIQNPKSQEDPVTRAKTIALKIEEFYDGEMDPDTITVSWDRQSKSYLITIEGQELVRMDQYTFIPDTTKKADLDALQATNRLRRLFGASSLLTEITGNPRSNPQTLTQTKIASRAFQGVASWYGPGFHGRATANGERFNQHDLTAAHRTLPFGTRVRVTNTRNGRSVVVRINDRGPFSGGRIIDLSRGAAGAIGLLQSGTAPVIVEVLR